MLSDLPPHKTMTDLSKKYRGMKRSELCQRIEAREAKIVELKMKVIRLQDSLANLALQVAMEGE